MQAPPCAIKLIELIKLIKVIKLIKLIKLIVQLIKFLHLSLSPDMPPIAQGGKVGKPNMCWHIIKCGHILVIIFLGIRLRKPNPQLNKVEDFKNLLVQFQKG